MLLYYRDLAHFAFQYVELIKLISNYSTTTGWESYSNLNNNV